MTTDEIKALIAQTIQGQGDAVDVGGGLAKILTAVVDNMTEMADIMAETTDTFLIKDSVPTEDAIEIPEWFNGTAILTEGISFVKVNTLTESQQSAIMDDWGKGANDVLVFAHVLNFDADGYPNTFDVIVEYSIGLKNYLLRRES